MTAFFIANRMTWAVFQPLQLEEKFYVIISISWKQEWDLWRKRRVRSSSMRSGGGCEDVLDNSMTGDKRRDIEQKPWKGLECWKWLRSAFILSISRCRS